MPENENSSATTSAHAELTMTDTAMVVKVSARERKNEEVGRLAL